MKIKLLMSESDIVRAIKNIKYSPLQILISRHFREDINNVEINHDSIILWNDEMNDYISYKYCTEDILTVKAFIDEWNDYVDQYVDDFTLQPISFCVEEKN
jgi:hypothetical protein